MAIDLILAGFAVVLVFLSVVVLWLLVSQRKLKQANQALLEQIDSIHKDVAGLCSAAVKVDSRLSSNTEQLADIFEQLSTHEQKEEEALPYHSVIQKVRAGASANELIKECGLSREEAALLLKLHGTDSM